MAKVCKFCSAENEDTLEFCAKCGSKLPVYTQFDSNLDFNTGKRPRMKLKLKPIITAIIIIAALFGFYKFFLSALPEDKLPKYEQFRSGSKNISVFLKKIDSAPESYNLTLSATPAAISSYLTSLINQSLKDKKSYDQYTLPRVLCSWSQKDTKKLSLVKRDKLYGVLNIRVELFFENTNNSWSFKNYKLNNMPVTDFKKDAIANYFFGEIISHTVFDKLKTSDVNMQCSKLYLTIIAKNAKKQNPQSGRKTNSLINKILQPMQNVTNNFDNAVKMK